MGKRKILGKQMELRHAAQLLDEVGFARNML
jgi:hypothetical protein